MTLCKRLLWDRLLFIFLIFTFIAILNLAPLSSAEDHSRFSGTSELLHPKEVIVIGGGIAGLAAARTLTKRDSRFNVKIFEARKDRFGGRIWTDKLTNMKARGPEVEFGAIALNTKTKNSSLLELARLFELQTGSLSNPQFIVPWEGKVFSGDELSSIMKDATDIIGQAVKDWNSSVQEISVKEAVNKFLDKTSSEMSFSPDRELVKTFPSYVMGDYSSRSYLPERRDAGFDTVLLDGMGELIDRLVSGSSEESPLHLDLGKAVRQVVVDPETQKVTVRTTDGLQTKADIVIVALPSSVLAAKSILFDPPLPEEYQRACQEMEFSPGNRVLVQFEKAFWPDDFGLFIRAVKTETERGHLQTWINVHRLVKKPVLAGMLTGSPAHKFEKLTEEEVKESVLAALTDMFGQEAVSQGGAVVSIRRSFWMSDPLSLGTGTYPKVGTTEGLWDVLSEPLCPYVYFAGEHTSSESPGTVHGAYNSGVRVGGQILAGYCDGKMEEKRRKEEEERRQRAAAGGDKDAMKEEEEDGRIEEVEEDSIGKDEL